MVFEMLTDRDFELNFGDLKECESLWKEMDEFVIDAILSTGFNFTVSELKEEMKEGKVVSTHLGKIRMKTDLDKCPLCAASFKEPFYSTSIVDNKTRICSDCGTREQLERYYGVYDR